MSFSAGWCSCVTVREHLSGEVSTSFLQNRTSSCDIIAVICIYVALHTADRRGLRTGHLQKADTVTFSHCRRLFFVVITPILYSFVSNYRCRGRLEAPHQGAKDLCCRAKERTWSVIFILNCELAGNLWHASVNHLLSGGSGGRFEQG